MNFAAIIPAFDPIPLPAPVWLLKTLLLLTLFLHLIAMNMLLGGAWLAAWSKFKSRSSGDVQFKLYKEMMTHLPTLVATTVTLGVAPLLFVQVLYGHLVYSASVAIGWHWWLVVPFVIVAYYIFYYLKFHSEGTKPGSKLSSWVGAIILLWISFILSNNFNLAQQPERFTELYLRDPSGWSLNLSDPSTFPRWLHMIISAFAVAGIWVMWLGRKDLKKEKSFAEHKLNVGYKMFAVPTMINIVVGFAFMMTLPKDVMMRLMGQGPIETALWILGMGLAIWAIPTFKKAVKEPEGNHLTMGTGMMVLTVVFMVILRDMVRSAYQGNFFNLSMPQVDTMWGAIVMFLIAFVIGLWTLWWLVTTFIKSQKNG